MDYLKLSEKIHQTAVEKGFWKTDSNQDEKFMLILTELGEAVESHRKGQRADKKGFEDALEAMDKSEDNFKMLFEHHIKDTVEDELADVVIRCLDYLRRYRKDNFEITTVGFQWSENFAENIFKIIRDNIDYQPDYIISYVQWLAYSMDIDLEWHIRNKMKYNSTREKLHGKAY